MYSFILICKWPIAVAGEWLRLRGLDWRSAFYVKYEGESTRCSCAIMSDKSRWMWRVLLRGNGIKVLQSFRVIYSSLSFVVIMVNWLIYNCVYKSDCIFYLLWIIWLLLHYFHVNATKILFYVDDLIVYERNGAYYGFRFFYL